ncbi:MAG: helix-turn-helix domain-containing protein [Phycisphaerae bacterium]
MYRMLQMLEAPRAGVELLATVRLGVKQPRPHVHTGWQLLFVLRGRLRVTWAGGAASAGAQQALVVAPRFLHAAAAVRHPSLFLDLRLAPGHDADADRIVSRFEACTRLTCPHAADQAARVLAQAHTLDAPTHHAACRAAAWSLLLACCGQGDEANSATSVNTTTPVGQSQQQPAGPGPDPRMARVTAMLRARLSQPTGVAEVAAGMGLSRSQLTRLVQQHHGTSPAKLLRRLRIEHARRLLAGGDLRVKEVAAACGFASANKFCRVFKEETATRPGDVLAGRL